MAKTPSFKPDVVLGRFNSSRNPENIYVVKRHPMVDPSDSKHISCTCPGWKFSPRHNDGTYLCRHTEYVREHGHGTIDRKYGESAINRATRLRKGKDFHKDPKRILAFACEDAGVHLSDHAFHNLVKALRPYLTGNKQAATDTDTDGTEVLRVITLD
jgi:hypothetical protein